MAIDRQPSDEARSTLKKGSEGIDIGEAKLSINNVALGQETTKKHDKKESPYNQAKVVENGTGKPELETAKNQFAPNNDKPTTAAAEPGKDLSSIIMQVDPMGKAQVFANMVKQFAMINMIMNIAGSAKKSSGGGGAAMNRTQLVALTDAFNEALCILCNQYRYVNVISVLNAAMENNGISKINPEYQDIVKGGIAKLIEKALIYGEKKIPVKEKPKITYGKKTPSNVKSFSSVPDLSVKQYYTNETDPFPGFVEYVTTTGELIYVKRIETDLPYETPEKECLALAENGIAEDLSIYFANKNLTATKLNEVLEKHRVKYEQNAMNTVMGKNSSTNLMSNLSTVLGVAGTIMNIVQATELLKGVGLDTGTIGSAIAQFSKQTAMLNIMTGNLKSAIGGGLLGGLLGNLGQLSALAGALGSLGISLPSIVGQIGNIAGLNVGALTGALSSISSVAGALTSAGINISSLASQAVGSAASINNISNALRIGGCTNAAVNATGQLLRNIGVS